MGELIKVTSSLSSDTNLNHQCEFQRLLGLFLGQFDSPNTRRSYHNDLKQFFKFIGHIQINKIKSEQILIYKEQLKVRGLAIESVARKVASIKSFFRWLEENNFQSHNPARLIRSPKISTDGKTPGLSDVEVRKLFETPDSSKLNEQRDLLILKFLLYLGLRCSELTNIRLKDFSKEDGFDVLTIMGKGNKVRRIPVRQDLIYEMQIYCERNKINNNECFLFAATKQFRAPHTGNPLTSVAVRNIFLKYIRRAGITQLGLTTHSTRITAASNLGESCSIQEIMTAFGWSSSQTAIRYQRRRGSLKNSALHRVHY